jgi:hypothetical protein
MARCNHEFAIDNNKDSVCIHCGWNKSEHRRKQREHKVSGLENCLSPESLNALNSIK